MEDLSVPTQRGRAFLIGRRMDVIQRDVQRVRQRTFRHLDIGPHVDALAADVSALRRDVRRMIRAMRYMVETSGVAMWWPSQAEWDEHRLSCTAEQTFSAETSEDSPIELSLVTDEDDGFAACVSWTNERPSDVTRLIESLERCWGAPTEFVPLSMPDHWAVRGKWLDRATRFYRDRDGAVCRRSASG